MAMKMPMPPAPKAKKAAAMKAKGPRGAAKGAVKMPMNMKTGKMPAKMFGK